MIQIFCKNTGTAKEFPEGASLLEMLPEFDFEKPYQIVSAKVNNVSQGLKYRAYHNNTVEFLDAREMSGQRVYFRSLCFLLCKAAHDVLPGARFYVEHPVSNGYYCNLRKADRTGVCEADIEKIRCRMMEIVEEDMPFRRYEATVEEVVKLFAERGCDDKVKLLQTSGESYMDYYMLGDFADYYYGRLVPSAGYLKVWALESYHEGILLRMPDSQNPSVLAGMVDQPKTFSMFNEALRWNIIMGLSNAGDVNRACIDGRASELIQVAEALQEKKIVQIAEEIFRRSRRRRR